MTQMRSTSIRSGWAQTWRRTDQREQHSSPTAGVVLGVLAGGLATMLGSERGMELRPTGLQIAGALAVAAVTLGAVSAARSPRMNGFRLVVFGAALLSAGAAAIHFAVIEAHFEEWWGYGAFFVASGVA